MAVLAAMLAAAGLQEVKVGAPANYTYKLSGFVALGASKTIDKATGGLLERTQNYFVGLGYRISVEADVASAEDELADVLDAFTLAFHANRTLGGTVETAALLAELPDEPTYRPYAVQEFRVYPLVIQTKQRETVAPG
jgi:hypothetical protein